jgi:hypothetical protein
MVQIASYPFIIKGMIVISKLLNYSLAILRLVYFSLRKRLVYSIGNERRTGGGCHELSQSLVLPRPEVLGSKYS